MRQRIASIVAVLLLASAAALAQVYAETPLTQPQYGPAPSDQLSPFVATNGTDFLAVWLDGRGPVYSLYATRVQRDGRILDGTGIRMAIGDPQTANVRLIGVFPMAGAYVIVFNQQRFLGDQSAYETYVARIGADGQLLDAPHLVLNGPFVRVAASNGARIVLAGDTLATLDDRGNLVERDIPGLAPAYGVSIASNGSTFLLVSYSYRAPTNFVTFTALDGRGHPTTSSDTIAPGSGDGPLIGSDGTDYLVLYKDVRISGTIAQVVTQTAVLRDQTTLPPFGLSTFTGSLVWTGSRYLFVSTSDDAKQEVAAATLSRSGAVLVPPRPLGIAGTPGATNPVHAAWNGAQALVVATSGAQDDVNAFEVNGVLASADALPLSQPEGLAASATMQIAPVIASGGVNDLVAWIEPGGIYAERVTPSGAVLDPNGIFLAAASFPSRSLVYGGPSVTLRVIFDGSAYIVAWSDRAHLQWQRVDPATGMLLGGNSLAQGNCLRSFVLVRGNANVFLVASTCSGVVMQLLAGPEVLAPTLSLPLPSDMSVGPLSAAWNGSEWLIVLQNQLARPVYISPPVYRGNLYAMRVSGALVPLDAQPIPIAVSDQNEFGAVVASNGSDFLVAWTHFYDNPGVRARVVHADGRTDAPVVVTTDGSATRDLVWDGARYAIAFATRNANSTDSLWLTHFGANDQLPISAAPSGQRAVTLIAPPGRPLRAAYDRIRVEPEYGGVSRVFVKDLMTGGGRRRVTRVE